MVIFKCNKHLGGEEWERWKNYLESKQEDAVLLPDSIDYFGSTDGDTITFTPEEDTPDDSEEETVE